MKKSYKFELNNKGSEKLGFLVPLELGYNLPFEVKRIFYTYGVPNEASRGEHAYYKTEQVLICVSGSLKIKCSYNDDEEIYELNKSTDALYIPPHIWRTTFDHSCDAVLLVLSSLEYDESDYTMSEGVKRVE